MIEEFVLQTGSTYQLLLDVQVPTNPDIAVKKEIDINVGVSDLVITLNGAQDLLSVSQLTKLEASVRNVDLAEDQDTLDKYTFSWTLFDENINGPAQDQLTAIEDESGNIISTAIETSTTNVQTLL